MKLLRTSDNRLILFEGTLFLKLLIKTTQTNTYRSLKPNITFVPVIQCEEPRICDRLNKEYELIVHILMSEDDDNTNPNKVIVRTRSTFVFSHDPLLTKQELFELILKKADTYASEHFYSYLSTLKKKYWQLDPKVAKIAEQCEYYILKLGTKYRPYPTVDYDSFFQ